MRKIEMVDLKGQYQHIKPEIDASIQSVIESSVFIKGPAVEYFQQQLERYLHVRHVILVGNGTDALRASLMALELKPGDEIITSDFTFVATAEVAASIGCTPVLVDVDPFTFCMNPASVEKAITSHTKVIVPVHLFGQCAPIFELQEIATRHHLQIIEDACQAINAEYKYKDGHTAIAGSMGMAGCTSFFPSKNLGCYGDGGAIYTNNDEFANKVRSITNHGMSTRYHYERIGINSRLDAIQAAILSVKLQHLDEYTTARQTAAQRYLTMLSDCNGITLPQTANYSTHVYHQFTIKVKNGKRDELKAELNSKGIPSMIYYPVPLHLQNPYKDTRYKKGDFKVTESLCDNVLSLPMHTEMDEEQQQFIADTIKKFLS
jgi:UDP-2-acetamido-2-deoxy-ribo-hexuluronate aminotransferase